MVSGLTSMISRNSQQPLITIDLKTFDQKGFEAQLRSLAPWQQSALAELKAWELPVGLIFNDANLANPSIQKHKTVLRTRLHEARELIVTKFPEFKSFLGQAHGLIISRNAADNDLAKKIEQSTYRVLGPQVLKRFNQAPFYNGNSDLYHAPLMTAMKNRILNKMA